MKIEGCEFPDALLYDVESNVWAKLEGGVARIGINTILSWLSGGFTSVTFKPNATIARGKILGAVDGLRHFDVVRSPLSGELEEFNQALIAEPRVLNRDPYGAGWFAKVKPLHVDKEIRFLENASEAQEGLVRKLKDLRVHCFAEFPDFEMFEIGVECSAVLVKLNELLENARIGTVVHIVSDDPSAEVEMVRWSDQTGNAVPETRLESGVYHFIVKKTK